MTNENLIRRYYDGDEQALEALLEQNHGLIVRVAEEAARDFNCLAWSSEPGYKYSGYSQPIIEDLCAEGAVEFVLRIRLREYDVSRGRLTTYLYPHLKGVMRRWLEQSIGNLALSKDEMAEVRQTQRLFHEQGMSGEEIAAQLGISEGRVRKHLTYGTHFFSVHDLAGDEEDGDAYEHLTDGKLSASADRIVYRKICLELLDELFQALPEKDREILGHSLGVFGYEKRSLDEIAMEEILTTDGVIKARNTAMERLKKRYPGSRLELWRTVNQMMNRCRLHHFECS